MPLSTPCEMLQAKDQIESTAGALAPGSILAYLLREAVRARGRSGDLSEHKHQQTAQMADCGQSNEGTADSCGQCSAADNGNRARACSSLVPEDDLAISAAHPKLGSLAQASLVQQMSAGQAGYCSSPVGGLQLLAEKCCLRKLSRSM